MADRKAARREVRKPAPTFTLTTRWVAVILALLTVAFFHEVVLEGRTFVSPDATAPAGFVRLGERSLWQDHVYPLWNPYVFLGMPSFASGAYNPLIYPPDWPLGLVQKVVPLPDMLWLILYYFLGGLFLYLLAREWGARAEGALLGAVAFVFAPNLVAVGAHGHGSQLVDSAYLPLMVWLTARWLRRGGLHHLAWLALAGGFQLLRGHVQICFYTWNAIGLYTVIEWVATAARRRAELVPMTARAAAIAGAAALAFGLSGFYSLPLRDYARWSIRGGSEGGGVSMEYATQWSLAPFELPSVVVPGWVGFGGATYWGTMPFTDYPNAYLGVVAVLLALPAFLANGAPRVFALVLGSLALLIAFGKHFPVYGFLYEHLPLFNKFRVPVMVIVLFQLAAALATAWGWSAILPGTEAKGGEGASRFLPQRVSRLLVAAAAVLALVLVVGVMGQSAWRQAYVTTAVQHRTAVMPLSSNMYGPEAATAAYQGFVSDLGRACLLGLLAIGVAWFARRGKLPAPLATCGVLALLLFELWPVSGRVVQGPPSVIGEALPRDLDIGRDDVVDFLEKAGPPGSSRILPLEAYDFLSNRFAGFGIASVGGMHAAKTQLFQDFLEATLKENLAWLRLLNVRYLVVAQPFENVPPFLREVHRGSEVVYENLMALPRATVVGSYRVVAPPKAILDSIKVCAASGGGMASLATRTLLERDPGLTLGPVEGARAEIVSYRLNDVTVEVETPGPGLLRLADLWYPDWRATVDGRPAPVLKADYLLRAVPVPAGRHRVVFRFESAAVRQGLLVSLASLVVVLALFGAAWLRRPRGGAPAAAAAGRREAA